MIYYRFLLLLSFFYIASAFPQEKPTLNDIRSAYESFEYRQVTELASRYLQGTDSLSVIEKNEVLLMKAVSHYALAEEQQTRKTFIEMLKNDKTVILDSVSVSPKIVSFFVQVRNDFLEMVTTEKPKDISTPVSTDKSKADIAAEVDLVKSRYELYLSGITKSLLLPGLGHYSLGQELKGSIIAGTALVNAAALIYYAIDTRKKESDYLSETNASAIASAYSAYNTSYKIRNSLISTLAVIWIYAQTDMLLSGNSVSFHAQSPVSGGSWVAVRVNFNAIF